MNKGRWKNILKQKQVWGFAGIICFVAVLAFYCYYANIAKITQREGGFFFKRDAVTENIGPLSDGDEITQTYRATRNGMLGISLAFNAVGDSSQVNLHMEFQEKDTGKIVQTWETPVNAIAVDGSMVFWPFSNVLNDAKGKEYILTITVENAAKENTITLLKTQDSYGQLKINGQNTEGNLALYVKGFVGYIGKVYWAAVLGFMLLISWLYWKMISRKKWKTENIFLGTGIFLCVIYLGIFTPYTEPDSTAHMPSIYYHAAKIMGDAELSENGTVLTTKDEAMYGGLTIRPSLSNYNIVKEKLFSVQNEQQQKYDTNKSVLETPASAYFPQICGVLVGKLLHLGTIPVLMLAKIGAAVFYLLCCYWSIRLIPFGKTTMYICALLPLSLELNTSSSYDNVTISLTFLLISYVLYCVYEKEKITWKDISFLALLNVWLAPVKVVYFLVGGMCILIPAFKYRKSIFKYLATAGVLLAGMVSIGISRLSFLQQVTTGAGMEQGAIEKFTIPIIFSEPLHSFEIIMRTLIVRPEEWLLHIFGGLFSWYSVILPWTVVVAFLILACLSLLTVENERKYLDIKAKICIGVLCFIMMGCTAMGLWLDWTPLNAQVIEGIQGRYFMPILPLLLFMLQNKIIVLKQKIDYFIIIAFCVMQFITFSMIFSIALRN